MIGHYSVDPITEAHVFFVPGNFVVRFFEGIDEIEFDYDHNKIANMDLCRMRERGSLDKAIESGLVKEILVEDGDLEEFHECYENRDNYGAEKIMGRIFEEARGWIAYEEAEWLEGEEEGED